MGAAVTVVNLSGNVRSAVGAHTVIGTVNDAAATAATVNGVTLTTNSAVRALPFDGVGPMAVGLGVSLLGSAAAGVVVVTLGGTTESQIGDDANIETSGTVALDTDSVLRADAEADGGAFGAFAVGAMFAKADLGGTTRSQVGTRAKVKAGSLKLEADHTSDASVNVVAAGGGAVSGRGAEAQVTVNPTVEAKKSWAAPPSTS